MNNTLFFRADDVASGRELWKVACAPALSLSDNGQLIPNGASTPSAATGSGQVWHAAAATFTIANGGTRPTR